MRVRTKACCVIGIVAAMAFIASAADARSAKIIRFGGAQDSVATPHAGGSIPYDAEGAPYPLGHGGKSASPDFQILG